MCCWDGRRATEVGMVVKRLMLHTKAEHRLRQSRTYKEEGSLRKELVCSEGSLAAFLHKE